MDVCLPVKLPGAPALTFNFSYSHFPLSLFPSISIHISPSALSAHYRDSPEVEDNPSSAQQVFHVLGRHAGESAASSLSSPRIPALASQPSRLRLFSTSLPVSFTLVLVFSLLFMFSFIMEPISSARDVTHAFSLCLDSTKHNTQRHGANLSL